MPLILIAKYSYMHSLKTSQLCVLVLLAMMDFVSQLMDDAVVLLIAPMKVMN